MMFCFWLRSLAFAFVYARHARLTADIQSGITLFLILYCLWQAGRQVGFQLTADLQSCMTCFTAIHVGLFIVTICPNSRVKTLHIY